MSSQKIDREGLDTYMDYYNKYAFFNQKLCQRINGKNDVKELGIGAEKLEMMAKMLV